MTYPQTYTEADAMLTGRCKERRKVGNNTYAERRADGSIAVKLHATDVVTFHLDGSLSLDTGGWLTVTTKDRINECLPNGYRLASDKGRWFLYPGTWSKDSRIPYADGMTIHADGTVAGTDSPSHVARQDAENAKARKDIARFVKGITPEQIVTAFENPEGDCLICRFGMADASCLASHVEEGYFHATLARNAVTAAGYQFPDVILSMAYDYAQRGQVDSTLTHALSKYLRKGILQGVAVA